MTPRFLPAAEAEFLQEVRFYTAARDGLGVKFADAVVHVVAMALANPQGGAPGFNGARSRIVKGFPFRVIYRTLGDELLVVAVAHHRRKPDYWRTRTR
jgi:toxin ParE1/3/4